MLPARTDPAETAQAARQWLSVAERNPPYLRPGDTLFTAIEIFQTNMDVRLLPVVDAQHRVTGAVFEKDVRRLLLNPFGHALMRNPAYGSGLAAHIRPCPAAEAELPVGRLIDAYRTANGHEGMIVTQGGRLFAVIANRRLIELAAAREVAAANRQLARAQRIEAVTRDFEGRVAGLAHTLSELSRKIGGNARDTAMRAGDTGDRAVAVAAASAQTGGNMAGIADRGRLLAEAFGAINADALRAKAAARDAVALVGDGGERLRGLTRSAETIDTVIALIGETAAQVNLLALNATIEAARAGEAGRGFTVVANEVKLLAKQAGEAAQRITSHIETICLGIAAVADGHRQVEQAIAAMARLSDSIEDAVAMQEDTTRFIAVAVEETAAVGQAIGADVAAIGGTARAAAGSAHDMGALATRIHDEAEALGGAVASFVADLRAA